MNYVTIKATRATAISAVLGVLLFAPHAHSQVSSLKANQVNINYNVGSVMAGGGYEVRGFATTGSGQLWYLDNAGVNHSLGEGTSVIIPFPSTATPAHSLNELVAGPDGDIWITDTVITANAQGQVSSAAYVDSFDANGNMTAYALPTAAAYPQGITVGPDGALWFIESQVLPGQVGRITTQGSITEFPAPAGLNLSPSIVSTSDGNLWFEAHEEATGTQYIGKMTTSGQYTTYPLPTGSDLGVTAQSNSMAVGSDGNIWALGGNLSGPVILKITPAGAITTFPLAGQPVALTSGPDGALWYSMAVGQVGRISTSGQTSTIPVPGNTAFQCQPAATAAINVGQNGSLVFAGRGSYAGAETDCYIASLVPGASSLWPGTGTVSQASAPSASAEPRAKSTFVAKRARPKDDDDPDGPLCGDRFSCYISVYPSNVTADEFLSTADIEVSVESENVIGSEFTIRVNPNVAPVTCTDAHGDTVSYAPLWIGTYGESHAGIEYDAIELYPVHAPLNRVYTCKIQIQLIYTDVESDQTTVLDTVTLTAQIPSGGTV